MRETYGTGSALILISDVTRPDKRNQGGRAWEKKYKLLMQYV